MGQFCGKTFQGSTSTDLTQSDEDKEFCSERTENLKQSSNLSTSQPSHAETYLITILCVIC